MQGGQHASRAQRRAVDRAADRKDLRRIAWTGAAIVAAVAIATAGVAGTGGAGSAVADPASPVGSIQLAGPDDSPTASPSPTPGGPAETPELRITLAYERHDRDLALTLTFAGYVFRPYSAKTGQIEEYPIPAKRDIGLYEHLDWGDGTSYTAPTKAQRCPVAGEKRMVHEVADRYEIKKKYRKSGDYTISYEYDACGLTNGKIAGQLKMHVP